MLKTFAVTTAAIAAIATGAIALDAKPAQADVSIQLVHGKWHGHGPKSKWHGHGPRAKWRHGRRFGFYGPYRPFCFTKFRTKRVRFWSPRRHRWVSRTVRRPITICR